jgi:hypothetical protein
MTPAQELVTFIESRGGVLTVEGNKLFVDPEEAGLPVLESLRIYRPDIIALIKSRPADDALGLWLLDRCVFDDRCAGGTGGLYLDFARWCASRGWPAPASRLAFVKALQADGFTMTPAELWHGLILREDMNAILEDA